VVEYSPSSLADLDEIWDWNAKQYGTDHANAYLEHLRAETRKLARSGIPGRSIHEDANLRYSLIRRGRRGYGHVVVFRVDGEIFYVYRILHTSQDWQREVTRVF